VHRILLVVLACSLGCAGERSGPRAMSRPVAPASAPPAAIEDAGVEAAAIPPDAAPAAPFEDTAILAWRVDGQALAIASGRRAVVVSLAAPDSAVVALAAAPSPHASLTFAPDGSRVASVGEDRVIRLYDAAAGTLAVELRAPDPTADPRSGFDTRVAFSADGARLVAATDRARVWEIAARRHVCSASEEWLHDVRLTADGREFAASSITGAFGRFGATDCKLIADGTADTGGTFGTDLSPDGRWLASSEQGHGLKIHGLQPKSQRPMKTPTTTCQHHVVPVFSRDGKVLVVTADWFRSYRVPGFTLVAEWTPSASEREAMDVTFDDGLHVLLRDDARSAIIDVRAPKKETRLDPRGAKRFDTSPDSAWLAGVAPGAVHVWNAGTGALVRSVPAP
jgi:WD40 repeat protein